MTQPPWVPVPPSFATPANPFGLHDMTGNVQEWCRDAYASYAAPIRPGDGERDASQTQSKSVVVRGGHFGTSAVLARVARRFMNTPETGNSTLGVRPRRRLGS